MTIQNIEDVMDRIMNLNRNLTEESLRTLLSASGWDKEDIMEGIHIFRSTRGSVEPVQPIQNFSTTNPNINQIDLSQESQPSLKKQDNTYTFNISQPLKTDTNSDNLDFHKEINHDMEIPKPVFNGENILNVEKKVEEEIPSIKINSNTKEDIKDYSLDSYAYNTNQSQAIEKDSTNTSHSNLFSNLLKTLALILGLVLISLLAFYFFKKNSFLFNKSSLNNYQEANIQNANLDNSNIIRDTGSNISSTTLDTSNNPNNSNIENLTKEIERLKLDLESYKNMVKPTTQTIVKYISQKGPKGATGSSGRGILAVDATTTGFIIRYTDNTSSVVPYSATTVLGVLDSQAICFRDASSTGYMINDTCLDKVKVLNLLNK